MNRLPSWVKIGAWVKVAEWYGKITDIAQTESGATMLHLTSFKEIARRHEGEWITFKPDYSLIRPATDNEVRENGEYYLAVIRCMMEQVRELMPDEAKLHQDE